MSENMVLMEGIKAKLRPVAWTVGSVSFFINLLILPMSLYALQVMDRVVNTGSMATLLWLTLIMIGMFAVAGILQSLRSMMLMRAADWMHEQIAGCTLPMVLTQAVNGQRGAQHLRDAATLRNFLAGAGLVTLLDAPWSVLYILALFIIHVSLGVLVTVGAIGLLALAWLNEKITDSYFKEAGAFQTRSMQELELATRNAEVTQAMGMRKALAGRWNKIQQHVLELQWQGSSRGAVVQGVAKFIRLSLQVGVTGLSAWLAIQGDVTTGAIIASAILASRALAPFEVAISRWKSMGEARASYMRLTQALAQQEGSEDVMALPAPRGTVTAENMEYTAPQQERPILHHIQFRLDAGEALGVMGASGSGKSTLARLVTGVMAPTAGAVRLDDADIYRWPREDFGRYVGYLPQDIELFSGTVSENISRFSEAMQPEAIVKAAQIANAHALILRMPQGYDTQIGPGGALLSAGQRQRIGLARAFYGDPRLLVLDEPDASLDEAGQHALISALRRAKLEGVSVIIITHRRALLAHVDKLLLLHDGTVAAFGPVSSVLESLTQHKAKRMEAVARA